MTSPVCSSATQPRPAVFFDRDGTLMEEVHYCREPGKVRALPGTAGALRQLREAGFWRFLVTNQSGLARGLITLEEYHAVQAELLRQIEGELDAVYVCADHPDQASRRRKPDIGMIEEALAEWPVVASASWMVGDKAVDIFCGQKAGLRTILVRTGYGRGVGEEVERAADAVVETVVEAVALILQQRNSACLSARENQSDFHHPSPTHDPTLLR